MTASSLPAHVVDEVLDLLADAILEDLRASPATLNEQQKNGAVRRGLRRVTVGPPRGSVRSGASDTNGRPRGVGHQAEGQA